MVVEDPTGDAALYSAGCINPFTTTSTSGVWTTKTWTPDKFFFQGGDPGVTLVGNEITDVAIVFDEGLATAILDNIRFNSLVAGGPAAAH